MKDMFVNILLSRGFSSERAEKVAVLFAETSLDGVYSHGHNRFPMFIDYIDRGIVDVEAEPSLVSASGPFERWDGNLGPGNLNASSSMARAIELAHEHGMGAVALRNSNHWMRGGSYGWQAAEAGCLAICFTNAISGMPPWGTAENRVGNNPFVMAVPREEGHIVLDMALSQFSYGRMHVHRLAGEKLPVPGGYDKNGAVTDDPAEILGGGAPLPIGYWKGSGMALMLDLFVALLSDGEPTVRIDGKSDEYGVCQLFIAFAVDKIQNRGIVENLTSEVIDYIHSAAPVEKGGHAGYPGERTLATRHENREKGIPVDETVWEKIIALAK